MEENGGAMADATVSAPPPFVRAVNDDGPVSFRPVLLCSLNRLLTRSHVGDSLIF